MTLVGMALVLLLGEAAGADTVPPPPAGSPPAVAPAKDPAALALLDKMCSRLKAAKTFTLRARTTVEWPVAGGALGTFFNDATVAVRRPDGLAARRTGDLPEFRFAYDGKSMAVLVPGDRRWSSVAAPPTIEAMLVTAGEQGGISLPLDELLVRDPCAVLTPGLTDAVRVGWAMVGKVKTEHVVLMNPVLQVELWIDPATGLPARSAAAYLDHRLRPRFIAEITDWKIDPKLPPSAFELPKPTGASEVPFREAAAAFR